MAPRPGNSRRMSASTFFFSLCIEKTFSKQVALLSLCKSCALQQEPAEDAEAVRLIVDFIENQLLNYQWNVSQPEGVLEWPAEWFTGALMQRWLLCSGISAQVEQLVIQSITQHLRNIRIHMQSAGCAYLFLLTNDLLKNAFLR